MVDTDTRLMESVELTNRLLQIKDELKEADSILKIKTVERGCNKAKLSTTRNRLRKALFDNDSEKAEKYNAKIDELTKNIAKLEKEIQKYNSKYNRLLAEDDKLSEKIRSINDEILEKDNDTVESEVVDCFDEVELPKGFKKVKVSTEHKKIVKKLCVTDVTTIVSKSSDLGQLVKGFNKKNSKMCKNRIESRLNAIIKASESLLEQLQEK